MSDLAISGFAVLTVWLGRELLHLSGLSDEPGHSEHGDGGSSEAGHVHVLDGDDEVSWSSGDCGHGHAQTD